MLLEDYQNIKVQILSYYLYNFYGTAQSYADLGMPEPSEIYKAENSFILQCTPRMLFRGVQPIYKPELEAK